MITREQAINSIKEYVFKLEEENKINKSKDIIKKISLMSDEEYYRKFCNTLGKNATIKDFENWLHLRLQDRELQGTEFIELNEMVSYNIAGTLKNTIALHMVPTHVTMEQIRNSESYLVDALEQLRTKFKNKEFENIETVLAVSDILKIKVLRKNFKSLGFEVKEGEEIFKKHFKNPYQASLDKKILISDEWEQLKEEFMKSRPRIEELRSNKENISRDSRE